MIPLKRVAILSGAGISAESGINTFRDSGGLWEQYKIEDVATPKAWARNPHLVLKFYNARRKQVADAKPNAGHTALLELEKYFTTTILTQNIDDLHERAGSKNVAHLHGEIFKARSTKDASLIYDINGDIHIGDVCVLGAQLRPHIVWFDEAVPMMDMAIDMVSACDIFCVIGTSLGVYPVAGLINYVSPATPIYIVDPHKPPVNHNVGNVNYITHTATVGVPILVKTLIEKYAC